MIFPSFLCVSYCFIEFEDVAAAEKAIYEYDGTEVDGSDIKLEFSKYKCKPNKCLFVGNLSLKTDAQTLERHFHTAKMVYLPTMENMTENMG